MIELPLLPLEIQGLIVDELGAMLSIKDQEKSAHSALLACHPTSKFLRAHAMRYLYEQTSFSNADLQSRSDHESSPLSLLKEILLSPVTSLGSVGPFIENLVVTFESSPVVPEVDTVSLDPVNDRIAEFLGDEGVVSILQALCKPSCRLKSFGLRLVIGTRSDGRSYPILDYSQLPSNFHSAFLAFASSPTMRSIEVQRVEPVRFLVAKRLGTSGQAGVNDVNRHPSSQAEDDADDGYSIDMCTDFGFPYSEILPKSYYRRLHSLVAFNTGARHSTQTWAIVDFASENLRKLSIFQYGLIAMPPQPFNLSRIPKLQSFTFLHAFSPEHEQTLNALHQLFNVKSPTEFLNYIELRIRFNGSTGIRDFFDLPGWDRIDDLLSGPLYAALRCVRFKIQVAWQHHYDYNWMIFAENATLLLEGRLPHLVASPTIRLFVDVDPVL